MDLETHALVARLHGIYAIVNEGRRDPIDLTRAILDGGARIVQYRAKQGIVPEHAHAMRRLTRERGALFILNDAWREVSRYDADGAHVGPDDASCAELAQVRTALGGRILGVSCGSEAEARIAQACGADYVGVGSVYATSSKDDAGAPIGIDGLMRIAASTRLPVAAIGGITLGAVPDLRAANVAMAAVISAIASASDPRAATADLVNAWNGSGAA